MVKNNSEKRAKNSEAHPSSKPSLEQVQRAVLMDVGTEARDVLGKLVAIVGHLGLAARHPLNRGRSAEHMKEFALELANRFALGNAEIRNAVMTAFDPRWDLYEPQDVGAPEASKPSGTH